jgi:hypothetical protein
MTGVFAANLLSLDEGEVQVDFENKEKAEHFRVSSAFKNNLSTKSNCESDPSESNCVFQSVKLFNPEDDSVGGAPNGMHLRIMTDDKINPTFYVIEGRYNYSAAKAAGFAEHGLDGTREIYFQTIQSGGQIWGKFEFRDSSDELISAPGVTGAILAVLGNGVCKNTSDGADEACGDIDTSVYAGLWLGRTQMDSLTTIPVNADFVTGKPTKSELCLTDFETCLDLSGN